jgi:hypothetical protein
VQASATGSGQTINPNKCCPQWAALTTPINAISKLMIQTLISIFQSLQIIFDADAYGKKPYLFHYLTESLHFQCGCRPEGFLGWDVHWEPSVL